MGTLHKTEILKIIKFRRQIFTSAQWMTEYADSKMDRLQTQS